MDFMNLHQAAHGDREFGFIETRLRDRPQDGRRPLGGSARPGPDRRLGPGRVRMARGAPPARRPLRRQHASRRRHRGRQGRGADPARRDRQRLPAERARRRGGGGARRRRSTTCSPPTTPTTRWRRSCGADGARRGELREAARIEVGLRSFLTAGGFGAFTDTFEDLGGLHQLPGIAVQRLMADGYGFGAEGDWKSAVLVRLFKVMASGLPGGTSFMEDYTYHLDPAGPLVLGAHMLEVCPSLAAGRPSCEIHPLSIGGRSDPVRLVFDAAPGSRARRGDDRPGRSLPDRGQHRSTSSRRPRRCRGCPVARALWRPRPDLPTAVEAWLHRRRRAPHGPEPAPSTPSRWSTSPRWPASSSC